MSPKMNEICTESSEAARVSHFIADWFSRVEDYLDGLSCCRLTITSRILYCKYASPSKRSMWEYFLRNYFADDHAASSFKTEESQAIQWTSLRVGVQVQVRAHHSPIWRRGTIISVKGGVPVHKDSHKSRELADTCVPLNTFGVCYDNNREIETDVHPLRIRLPGQTQPIELQINELVDARFRSRECGGTLSNGFDMRFFCRARVIKTHINTTTTREIGQSMGGNKAPSQTKHYDPSTWSYDLEYDDGALELCVPRCVIEAQHRDGVQGENMPEVAVNSTCCTTVGAGKNMSREWKSSGSDADSLRWAVQVAEREHLGLRASPVQGKAKSNSTKLPPLSLNQRKFFFACPNGFSTNGNW